MLCPRRPADPGHVFKFLSAEDDWRDDGSCSYCGSMNPDTLMERLEAGTVSIGATDKNYKIYVHNEGGEPFRQTYRDCPRDSDCTYENCTHWVTRDIDTTKFYFMHFSQEQMQRFVDLYNEKRLKFSGGFSFYVWPYFMKRVEL